MRRAPSLNARVIKRLPAVRPDQRLTIVHATRAVTDGAGREWVQLALQMRPNNTKGWALHDSVALYPTSRRIVVDLSSER